MAVIVVVIPNNKWCGFSENSSLLLRLIKEGLTFSLYFFLLQMLGVVPSRALLAPASNYSLFQIQLSCVLPGSLEASGQSIYKLGQPCFWFCLESINVSVLRACPVTLPSPLLLSGLLGSPTENLCCPVLIP